MIRSYFRYTTRYLVRCFPGSGFRSFRNFLWRLMRFNVHPDANLMPTVVLICGNIEIGARAFVGEEVMITGGSITIGSNCDIAPRCTLHGGSHEFGSEDRRAGKCFSGTITIGDGSWLGTNATVLAGARIGRGTIVAAGSVVIAGQYPDNVLLAGVPARIVKSLPPLASMDSGKEISSFEHE